MNQLALELDINSAVDNIRDVVLELLHCERVTLFLVDSQQKELRSAATASAVALPHLKTGSHTKHSFSSVCCQSHLQLVSRAAATVGAGLAMHVAHIYEDSALLHSLFISPQHGDRSCSPIRGFCS